MAKKAQSTIGNMLLSLTLIALVAAAALAALNGVTEEPIKQTQEKKVTTAISEVLPGFATLDEKTINGHACHIGLDSDGNMMGAAIEAGSDKGFGGHLEVMVGFDMEGTVKGYKILETHETPGLGAKADQWFQEGGKGNVIGRKPAEQELAVKKDQGEIDAISGSTITSRAFLATVNEAAQVFNQVKQ